MTRHMRLDVAGAIKNGIGWKWVTGPDGKPIKKRDAINWLLGQLAAGKRYLPIGDCNDFDPENGCRGHDDSAGTPRGGR